VTVNDVICRYISAICAQLIVYNTVPHPESDPKAELWREAVAMSPNSEWKDCVAPYARALIRECDLVYARSRTNSISISSRSRSSSVSSNHGGSIINAESRGCSSPLRSVFSGLEEKSAVPAAPCSSPSSSSSSSSSYSADGIAMKSAVDDKEEAEENALEYAIEKLTDSFRVAALGPVPDLCAAADAENANLCNVEFSLAFGGKILLHNTFLRLGKGRCYGLMGKNGAGKTTLLTNIGSGHIEGMPPHLKMIYVQHDDASDDFGVSMLDEMMAHPDIANTSVSRDEAIAALREIKFTETMLSSPRSALSGGWKMKLLIVRAMLAR